MKNFLKSLLVLIIACTSLTSCYTRIDSANTGLKVDKYGNDKGEISVIPVRGAVWFNPFYTDIYEYPNYVQNVDYPVFSVNTKDGSEIRVDVAMSYYITQGKAGDIFLKYRKDVKGIEAGYIQRTVYEAYRNVANGFTVDSLMGNRSNFDATLKASLSRTLNDEGFILETITGKIDPPASMKSAIDAKNLAIQTALQANNKVAQAEAEAKIRKAEAEGQAQAIKIKADAEAYANRVVAASITPTLVEMRRVETWDGKVSLVSGGTNIVDLKGLTK